MRSAEIKDIDDFVVVYQAADDKKAEIVARLDKSEAENILRKAVRP